MVFVDTNSAHGIRSMVANNRKLSAPIADFLGIVTGFPHIATAFEVLEWPVGTDDGVPVADGYAEGQQGSHHEALAALPAHGSGSACAPAR